MPLERRSEPFDHPDWIFELKYDGYPCVAYLDAGAVRLVSRRGREFTQYVSLATALAREIRARDAVIDGELAVLDEAGKPVFAAMRSRRPPVLIAFDLLQLDGEDLRALPLVERKARLRKILPKKSAAVLYLQHVDGRGRLLYALACEQDLEGIVAKKADAPYDVKRAQWVKIKNPAYSQAGNRWGDRS